MEFCIKLIFVQPYISSEDTLCYIPLLFHAFPFIFSFFTELRPTYYITPGPKRKPRSSRLLDKPAASDYNTKKEFADVLFAYFSHQLRERIFFMEPKTKQYLLITVVGVTLFVALLRLSSVLAFAAQLVDLVLPILAGGILALFINVPMTGLEKRLKRLFCKAKKQPSDKVLHLLSFFITLLGVVLVLVLALTLLIPELVQSFHSLYVQIEANIPRWTAYLSAQDADMGWLMSWLEGIDWEQLLHRVTDTIDTVLVNAVGAVSATVNIVVTASFALIISVYMSVGSESLCHHARTLVCAYLKPSRLAAEVLSAVPAILCKLSDRAMQRGRNPWRSHGSCVFRFQDPLRQPGGNADRHLRHYPLRRSADLLRGQRVPRAVGGSRSGRALPHCLPCRAVY